MNTTLKVVMATKQILIVDDEAHVREVVQTCLETLGGWKVLPASSSWDGLLKAQTEQPDVILLDVMMPEMDGFSFLRQLQSNTVTRHIPVILLTAIAYQFNRQQLAQLGVRTAIAKPFNPVLLTHQIARAVGWEPETLEVT